MGTYPVEVSYQDGQYCSYWRPTGKAGRRSQRRGGIVEARGISTTKAKFPAFTCACDEHHGECNCVVVEVSRDLRFLKFGLVSICGTHPEMLQVGVGDEHEINPFHNFPQRFEQGRVEVDIPSAVQQDRHATDLGCDAAGSCYGKGSNIAACSTLNPIFKSTVPTDGKGG